MTDWKGLHKQFPCNAVTNDGLANARVERVCREIKSGSSVLDVGCNDGSFGAKIINEKGCRVVGIDISEKVRKHAIEKGIKFIQGDICNTDIEGEQFDFVNASETLEHIDELDKALARIKQAMKPDGVFCGTVPHPDIEDMSQETYHVRAFTAESLVEVLSSYWKSVDIETVPGLGKWVGKGQHLFFRAHN